MFNGQVRYVQHLVLLLVFLASSTRADGPSSSKQVTTRGAKSESKQVDAASHNGLNGTHVVWPEKRVLVEGKWLRDGKRSDNRLPESGQAMTGCGAQKDANVESYESLHRWCKVLLKISMKRSRSL